MSKDEINEVIMNIMFEDGPDGHCDGMDVIVDFIIALLNGKENEWKENYYTKKGLE